MKTVPLIRATVAATLLVLAVSACGGEVPASPSGGGYSPPDPATATAESIELDHAVAVSPDGARIVVVEDSRLCVRDRVPTGAKGTSATCSDDEIGKSPTAVFSPNGGRLVAFENVAQYGSRGRAWIVDGTSGTTTAITLPATASSSPGSTSTGSTSTGSTGPSTTDGPRPGDAAISYLWQSDDVLFAVGITGAVYRVTPSTGDAVVVTPGGDRSTDRTYAAALGGGTIAMVVQRPSQGGTRLVTVSVVDGTVRDPAVEFGDGRNHPVLLGVSPDGTKALLSSANLQTLVPGETRIYDLTSGQHSVIPGTQQSLAAGGAFSPDGSLVAIVATGALDSKDPLGTPSDGDDRFHLQLAPADASAAPRDLLGADEESSSVYGPLQWSTADVIATMANPVPTAAAWTVSG